MSRGVTVPNSLAVIAAGTISSDGKLGSLVHLGLFAAHRVYAASMGVTVPGTLATGATSTTSDGKSMGRLIYPSVFPPRRACAMSRDVTVPSTLSAGATCTTSGGGGTGIQAHLGLFAPSIYRASSSRRRAIALFGRRGHRPRAACASVSPKVATRSTMPASSAGPAISMRPWP